MTLSSGLGIASERADETLHMQAMLLLFELTTMDNWPTVMHSGMDAAGVDVQPVTNRSSSFSLFFVVFICVSAFFLTRAFIGVFIKQVGSVYAKP